MLAVILLLQSLTIAVSGPETSPEYLPLRVAEAEGYFADAGLEVTLLTTRAESGAAEALAQKTADLAATSVEAALRFGTVKQGEAPRLVFGLTAAPPVVLAVNQRWAGAVRSIGDLAGTTVGITSPGAPEQTWFLGLLARADLRVTQVSLMSLGLRRLAAAVAEGEVAAGLIGEPLASRLLEERRVFALADFRNPQSLERAFGRPTVNAAVWKPGHSRLKPADLEAFCRALLRAVERTRSASPEDLAARLPRAVVGTPDDFAVRLAGTRGIYLNGGLIEPDALEATISVVRAHVPLPRTPRIPRASEMLHTEPLRQALRRSQAR
jgi:NitT/TauT family transport system substrate-binding protein